MACDYWPKYRKYLGSYLDEQLRNIFTESSQIQNSKMQCGSALWPISMDKMPKSYTNLTLLNLILQDEHLLCRWSSRCDR